MKMYREGAYGALHENWHAEDGLGKALDIWHGIEDVKPVSICEVGCGTGAILAGLNSLARERGRSLNLTGLDIAPYAVARGRDLFPGLDLRVANFLDCSERFDAVLFYDVLEHLENPFEFLRHAHKLADAIIVRQPLQGDVGMFRSNSYDAAIRKLGHIQFSTSRSFIAIARHCGWEPSNLKLVAPWEMHTYKGDQNRLKSLLTKCNRELLSALSSGFYLNGSLVKR